MNGFETEKVSDEMLMALADGELAQADAAALRARIAADPALAARFAVFTETADALRKAFVQPDMPERLTSAIHAGDHHAPSGGSVIVPFQSRFFGSPMALAASLVVGLGLGWILNGGKETGTAIGLPQAAAALVDVATGETQMLAGLGEARVLGSYETMRGLCRLIAVQQDTGHTTRFLACRDQASWDTALVIADSAENGFAPASEAGTEMVDIFLESIGSGPALTPEEEAEKLN